MTKFTVVCLLIILVCGNLHSQNNPYGVLEDQTSLTYYFVQLDPLTGSISSLVSIPGMTSFVIPDQSVIDYHNNTYIFAGFASSVKTLYTIDLTNATLLSSIPFPQNVLGLQYNCNDSLIYALYEFNNSYEFVTLNPITATITTISSISAPLSAYSGGTFTLDVYNNLYSFIVNDGTGLRIYAFDIDTGTLLYNNPWASNVVGQVFNGADSTIYGVLEVGSNYNLVSVDQINGTYNTIGTLAGVTPGFFSDATTISQNGTYVFRGFNASNNPALFTVDVKSATVLNSVALPANVVGYELPVCFTVTTVNVQEQNNYIGVHVFPNPVINNIHIKVDANLLGSTYSLIDMAGNTVLTGVMSSENEIFDLSRLSNSTYILQIGDSAKQLIKVIKP